MKTIYILVLEFFCGSLMFSFWFGQIKNIDLRSIRDGNPGAFNLIYAAGFKIGILGVLLDFLKGYFPLILFINNNYYLPNNKMKIIVALAPILGHAFSPFLKFNGGKSVAVTFGVWSAVSNFEISFAYAIILAILFLGAKIIKDKKGYPTTPEEDALMIIIGFLILLIYILANSFAEYITVLWFLNLIVFIYKNKDTLYTLYRMKLAKR
ncbi:glycerol-3-phosphate acyltransferase [Caldicellulosiruptoraceae bacterium PP1]